MNITTVILTALFIAATALHAQPQKTVQTVRGKIVDAESNAPLTGITATIQLDSAKRVGGISDKSGAYRIKNVPVGRHTITFSGVGYEKAVLKEILVSAGKETIIDIALTEKISTAGELTVSADRSAEKAITITEYAAASARAFNIEDTKKYAGSLGDPSRMAQNFAGVTGANDSRNDIVVRGNSPAGMLWRLEGINIPNPNHFGSLNSTGGPVSMLNNNTLDKSDFLTGAFPAQYGNAYAGVFDLRLRNGNAEKHEFIGQVGFNGFEAGAEGPLGMGEGSSYLLNYRYSTLGLFKAMGIDFGTGGATPNYQDGNLKINIPISDEEKLMVFALGGLSDIAFLGNDIDTTKKNFYGDENQNIRVDYKTGIAGISYENNLTENTFLKATVGISGTNQSFNGDSIDVKTRIAYKSGESRFVTTKFSGTVSVRHKLDTRNSFNIGVMTDREQFTLSNKNYPEGVEKTRVNIADGATLMQGWAQWKHRFTDNLVGIAGIYTQHYSLGNAFAVEPRASVQYFFGDGQSLALAYGLHSQTQNIYDYFVETDAGRTNINMGFTKSHHVVLSYDWTFAENWRLKTEVYYQSLFDIPVSNLLPSFSLINAGTSFAPNNESNLVNKGTARNFGAELTLERFFADGFYVLATGSLFDSRYKGSDGIERNTAFNTGYVANLLGGKEFALGEDVLTVSVRLSATGGKYLTPIDFTQSAQRGTAIYDNSRAYSIRQTPYFRTDVKLAYRMNVGFSTMEFAMEIQNITNNQNIFQQNYNRRTNSISTEYQQGFFLVPMFRWTF